MNEVRAVSLSASLCVYVIVSLTACLYSFFTPNLVHDLNLYKKYFLALFTFEKKYAVRFFTCSVNIFCCLFLQVI